MMRVEGGKRMYTIAYKHANSYRGFLEEYIFNSYEDAKQFLLDQQFVYSNREFSKKSKTYGTHRKAYILLMKEYSSLLNKNEEC